MARQPVVSQAQVFAACKRLYAQNPAFKSYQVQEVTGGGKERIAAFVSAWRSQQGQPEECRMSNYELRKEEKDSFNSQFSIHNSPFTVQDRRLLLLLERIAYQTSQTHLSFQDYLGVVYAAL